jgi:hypothetical protein
MQLTEARSSKSKWLSTLCLVTVLATPLECRPSNCLDRRLPSHRSNNGVIPRMKKSHTRHPGAQKPQPGPLPTGPCTEKLYQHKKRPFLTQYLHHATFYSQLRRYGREGYLTPLSVQQIPSYDSKWVTSESY